MEHATLEQKVEYLMDRAAITDVMGRYSLGMDLRDWDMYRSCWAEDVTFDVTSLGVTDAPVVNVGVDVWVRALQAAFASFDRTQHIKYPVSFELSGDSATVYAIMQGKHWARTPTGDPLQTMVGYYRDLYVRTEHGWKMSSSSELLSWNEGNYGVISEGFQQLMATLRTAG